MHDARWVPSQPTCYCGACRRCRWHERSDAHLPSAFKASPSLPHDLITAGNTLTDSSAAWKACTDGRAHITLHGTCSAPRAASSMTTRHTPCHGGVACSTWLCNNLELCRHTALEWLRNLVQNSVTVTATHCREGGWQAVSCKLQLYLLSLCCCAAASRKSRVRSCEGCM